MIETVTTVEARNKFSRLINRVAYGKERLVITRREMKLAALIPFHELQTLMQADAKRKAELLEFDWPTVNRGT
jgi:prevent-host-death family protein